MMSIETVRQVNREMQLLYIQSLRDELPDEPVTEYEFDLHRAISRDIESAARILQTMEG